LIKRIYCWEGDRWISVPPDRADTPRSGITSRFLSLGRSFGTCWHQAALLSGRWPGSFTDPPKTELRVQ